MSFLGIRFDLFKLSTKLFVFLTESGHRRTPISPVNKPFDQPSHHQADEKCYPDFLHVYLYPPGKTGVCAVIRCIFFLP